MSKVNHPSHYQSAKMEVIDIIRAFDLNFATGNAIKYILRAGKKDGSPTVEDYKKAIWYLCNEVEALSGEKVRAEVIEKDDDESTKENPAKLKPLRCMTDPREVMKLKWVVASEKETGIPMGTCLELYHMFIDSDDKRKFNARNIYLRSQCYVVQLEWITNNYLQIMGEPNGNP